MPNGVNGVKHSTMAIHDTIEDTKPNIGVFTNPDHDLWVAETSPSLNDVKSGSNLAEGEVYIAVKSTGICGSDVTESLACRIVLTLMLNKGPLLATRQDRGVRLDDPYRARP